MSNARILGETITHAVLAEDRYVHTWTECNVRIRWQGSRSEFDSTLARTAARTDDPVDCMTCLVLQARPRRESHAVTNPCAEIQLGDGGPSALRELRGDPGEPGLLPAFPSSDPDPH